MYKSLSIGLGIVALTACSGYEALDLGQKGPRIYLSKAKVVPTLFENYRCPSNPSKVEVCHVPPGNPANKHTICIGLSAVDAHVGHHIADNGEEDYLGDCNASDPGPTPDSTGDGTGGSTGGTGNGTDGGGTDGGGTDGGGTDGGGTDGGGTDGGGTDGGGTDGGTTDGGTTGVVED